MSTPGGREAGEAPPDGPAAGRPPYRVLQLITRLIVGGAQEHAIATAEKLDPARFEAHLWTGPQAGREGSLLKDARARGLRIRVLPDLVREIHPWKDLSVTLRLARLLRRERFDLVNTHSSKAGIVGRLAARLAGVPVVVHTVHGWSFHERMPDWRSWMYVALERALAGRTDRLESVSESTTRLGWQKRIGRPAQYVLIRSGVPLDRFRADPEIRARLRGEFGWTEDVPVVGSVGRLSAQKNPADFVRLAERIAARHPAVRFLYVGDGPLRPEIEGAVAAAGLGNRVKLAGLRDDVPDLLRAMDVFVLTSLWEGMPRVVPQALATGVPVAAYDVAGIREAVHDDRNGYTVPPGDVDALAARVDRLVADPAFRRELGRRAAAELDESFSEVGMLRRITALYDELLAGRPPRRAPAARGRGGGIPGAAGRRGPEPGAGTGGGDRAGVAAQLVGVYEVLAEGRPVPRDGEAPARSAHAIAMPFSSQA